MTLSLRCICMLALMLIASSVVIAQQENANDPLVRVLVSKGVLTAEEARVITANGTPVEQRDRLAALLREKGVISATEYEAVRTSPSVETAAVKTMTADYKVEASAKTACEQRIPRVLCGTEFRTRSLQPAGRHPRGHARGSCANLSTTGNAGAGRSLGG